MPNTYQSTRWTGVQIDQIYPVGSLYFSVNNTDPGTLFGGVWQRIEDTFLLCAGSTYAAGTTGGAASVTSGGTALTVAQLPAHTHNGLYWLHPDDPAWTITLNGGTYGYHLNWDGTGGTTTGGGGRNESSTRVGNTGSGQAHTHTVSTMPPYLSVYVWKRTA